MKQEQASCESHNWPISLEFGKKQPYL